MNMGHRVVEINSEVRVRKLMWGERKKVVKSGNLRLVGIVLGAGMEGRARWKPVSK